MGAVIQIYGRKKCADTRKAQRFFKERRIPIQNVDLDQKAPGPREIELFVTVLGEDRVLDTSSKAYGSVGLAYKAYDLVEELSEHPELLRTPIVRRGRELACGADEEAWKRMAEGEV